MSFHRKDSSEDDRQQRDRHAAEDGWEQPTSEADEQAPPSETINLERDAFPTVHDLAPAPDRGRESGEYRIVPKEGSEFAAQDGWYLELKTARSSVKPLRLYVVGDAVLGRTGSADIALDELDASQKGVSRRHALLRPTPTHLYLIELGSTNGTLLNGLPLGPAMARPLRDDDVLSLGELRLTVKVQGPAPETRPNISVVDLYVPDVLDQRDRATRRSDPNSLSTGPMAGHGEDIDYGD